MSTTSDSEERQTILIVDDTPDNITLIATLLKKTYKTKIAINGMNALQIVSALPHPDLILLDVVMPDMDGYEVCRRLKADPTTASIPIIFLSAMSGPQDEEMGLKLGAVDYVPKPISAAILLARVATHLSLQNARKILENQNSQLERLVTIRTQQLVEHNRTLEHKVAARTIALNSALEAMSHVANIDSLTKAYNRHYLDTAFRQAIEMSQRHHRPLAAIILDIDHFKRVNDTFGHTSGDMVLVEVSNALQLQLRTSDTLGRWGGEEFIVLAPETDREQALLLAERLRTIIAERVYGEVGNLTISLGVATYIYGDTAETLVKRADIALYQAKQQGRNRVEVADTYSHAANTSEM